MAKEEIIARACEDILSMSEQGRKIFKSLSESEQKTLVDKIKAIINDLLNWVDNLLNSYKATSKEAHQRTIGRRQCLKSSFSLCKPPLNILCSNCRKRFCTHCFCATESHSLIIQGFLKDISYIATISK